jgi:membrane-bound serine protease (ClpP class)
MKFWLNILFALVIGISTRVCAAEVGLIEIKGAIGPATASYIARAIKVAERAGNIGLVIQLDTPGGLLDSTEAIVQSLYDSKVPTVVFVAPAPARAGSAGVFITMAADVAAMAPHTRIGAAHPVNLGGGGEEKTDEVMKKKLENDTSSFAESIADKRNRNVEWARAAVIESASITAEKALDLNVIDLIATDLADLLKQVDGREISGKALHTADARVINIPMKTWERFSQLFLRPEVMFILMLAVIYGLIGELSSPGAILPGVVGAIALILVLYMSAILPINIAGVAFIVLAVGLFVIDIFSPSNGVLTFGGIVAFFFGALMLFSDAEPGFRLPIGYIVGATLLTAGFFIFVAGAGLRAQRLPVQAGPETLLGKVVPALERIDASGGKVFVEGELWSAVSETPIEKDQLAEIVAVTGLTLKVKPKQGESA